MPKLKSNGAVHNTETCNSNLKSIGDALYAIGGKWKLRIIVSLNSGPRRFNDMQRAIEGISAKVLSAELKELEMNGFVKRNVFTSMPVIVEYELTDYAATLGDVLDALSTWGAMHRENVKKSMTKQKAEAELEKV